MTAPSLVMPCRIRLSRTKGFRLVEASINPIGVVNVARPGPWGNPYVIHKHTLEGCGSDLFDCPLREDHQPVDTADEAVRRFKHILLFPCQNDPWYPALDTIRRELAGKDLACWCAEGTPCHADVLLELANPDREVAP